MPGLNVNDVNVKTSKHPSNIELTKHLASLKHHKHIANRNNDDIHPRMNTVEVNDDFIHHSMTITNNTDIMDMTLDRQPEVTLNLSQIDISTNKII